MRSTVVSRLAVIGGLLVLATAAVLALAPLHGTGLAGNAVRPRYGGFYVAVANSQPLPAHPTSADLRRAGVIFPQDRVRNRRYLVAAVGVTGVAATALGLLVRRRTETQLPRRASHGQADLLRDHVARRLCRRRERQL